MSSESEFIIATSVDVKRAFSPDATCTPKRNLSDEFTRKTTLLASWLDIPDLVEEDEFVEKWRRERREAAKA